MGVVGARKDLAKSAHKSTNVLLSGPAKRVLQAIFCHVHC